jgi:hypothetical protein
VIRNKSPGDEGPVTQTNSVQSTAGAANSNAVDQTASQPQSGSGPGSGQSQGATQSAPTVQTAGATATSLQGAPTNTSVMIDPAASDPNGSGAIGTLIQVWIPNDPQTSPAGSPAAGEVVGANSSTATASAGNTNHVTQSAVQQQDAGGRPSSGPPTQVGGGTQTQVLEQSAPTTQIASAEATSIQGGAGPTSISSAAAQASNVSEVTQSATQIQHGGVGGSQVQVIRQEAPTTQWVNAESTAAGSGESHSSSNSTNSGSSAVSQSAVQVQVGEGSQVQIVDQDVGSRSGGQSRATSLAVSRPTARATWLAASSGSPAESRSIRSESGRRDVRDTGRRAPQEPREPGPQESSLLGAPGNGAPGVSLWAFAALLVPFFLTAPWWARRHRSAAIRRLLSVVLRLERPG